ncbi:MAG: chitobiase/beta-hexosaminidase C-terminal domain-containing protein [Chitinophagaceae bacterium]
MQRWKNNLFNASFALNCLLVFLVLLESRLSIPVWLQVVGRMHPLILHFPVTLVILYALVTLVFSFQKRASDAAFINTTDLLLLLASLSSVITALAGIFLSREEGYDPEALSWHKWSGVAVSVFTLGWYYFNRQVAAKKIFSFFTSVVALAIIIFAGHQGAGITHGQNFLLAPMLPEKKQPVISPDEAIVFAHMVKPILEKKCESCHNNKKAKGELVMETEALLLKGGKNGKLWDSTAADFGLLLRRVHLPLEAKKHMPPQGKPQLTEEELEIIMQWIRKGADFNLRVADLSPADTLRQIAGKIFTAAEMAEYDFDEADPAEIEKLNTVNRVVTTEAIGSPALAVSFFNSNLFQTGQLKELNKVKKQIVTLDLARMPLKEEDIKNISEFENLRRLNLSFTGISGASLQELKKLKYLKSLSLSGTQVKAKDLEQLKTFPGLKTVYTWNTPIAAADIEKLQAQLKDIRFETGFRGDTIVLKLSPPVLLNEEGFITEAVPLKLKHYIQGTVIRFTMDGSDPDSISSPVFKGDEKISSNTEIKAKAYKPGWISSDLLEVSFYRNTYTPDTVIYLTKPNEKYKDEGNKLLIDHKKGEADFRFGNWVAFRENRMECILQFATPVPVQSITLSSLVDAGSYIMPAASIEIWGGDDLKNMKRLGRLVPKQPLKIQGSAMKGFECKFDTTTVKYIKVVGNPVAKLPAWHPGKGDKAWLFVDEVLVN